MGFNFAASRTVWERWCYLSLWIPLDSKMLRHSRANDGANEPATCLSHCMELMGDPEPRVVGGSDRKAPEQSVCPRSWKTCWGIYCISHTTSVVLLSIPSPYRIRMVGLERVLKIIRFQPLLRAGAHQFRLPRAHPQPGAPPGMEHHSLSEEFPLNI